MLVWVHQELRNGASVTRLSIQTKAIALAQKMQLPSNLTCSKGWVRSFLKRHRIELSRESGSRMAQLEAVRHDMQQVHTIQEEGQRHKDDKQDEKHDKEKQVEEPLEMDLDVDENDKEEELEAVTTPQLTSTRMVDPIFDTSPDSSSTMEDTRPDDVAELLLKWMAGPGSTSRWWLWKREEEREAVYAEIKQFLRAQGVYGISSAEIRLHFSMFVTTFEAAQKWLRQAKVEYRLKIEDLNPDEMCMKKLVLQLCPYFERLVSVLAAYVNYDDCTDNATPTTRTLATSTEESTEAHDGTRACGVASISSKLTAITDGLDNETKAQRRRLFELECARLQSELETKNIQLMLEKTLARKKLRNAGISAQEVDRIFPF
ncbi:hypothetical protein PsorP6_013867 [Peronosclerospora sorghi]|uniref:Uncharacterized protein n=1 Tax=Peronosclerospora sorghi TaxID=230839 RepID=A0ACC0VIX6_9STRA|nr:hypothetical protein PsorP6_013867 [Peronosclerospora sorghi]